MTTSIFLKNLVHYLYLLKAKSYFLFQITQLIWVLLEILQTQMLSQFSHYMCFRMEISPTFTHVFTYYNPVDSDLYTNL